MKARKSLGILSVLMIAGVALSGCLDEKRDRITKYEPGVYKGRADTQLSVSQRDALAERAAHQGGVAQVGGGSATPSANRSRASSVRAPSGAASQKGQ